MNREQTGTSDRRKNARRRVLAQVRMTIENPQIQGVSDNLSQVGLLFFSQDAVRVTVEVDDEGETKVMHGKLVRAQRMKETSTGFAVEFDPE